MKHYLYCIAFILLLPSCTTLETYIDNTDSRYDVVPIVVEQKLFKARTLSMGDYDLIRQNYRFNDSFAISIGSAYYNNDSHSYILYREGSELYKIVIESQALGLTLGGNSSLEISKWFLRFGNDSVKNRCEIGGADTYLTINDELAGIISFTEYRSRNKNDPKGEWDFHTGFTVAINGEEYGILALYNPGSYRNKNYSGKRDREIEGRLAMYALAVYESWKIINR